MIDTCSIRLRSIADVTYLIMAPVPDEGHMHNPLQKKGVGETAQSSAFLQVQRPEFNPQNSHISVKAQMV